MAYDKQFGALMAAGHCRGGTRARESTPRLTDALQRSAPTRQDLSSVERRWPRPSLGISCSPNASPANAGRALAASGARVQRPMWASTSTKNRLYSDTLYVDELIGPDTVNTLPETTIAAFEDHGQVARTIDEAAGVMRRLAAIDLDMDDVGRRLEDQGVAAFHESLAHVLRALASIERELLAR